MNEDVVNQSLNPASQDVVVRNQDGTFSKGFSGNPSGENGTKGWTPYRLRCQALLEKYTAQEIKEFTEDESKLNKLSSIDAIAVIHLARAIYRGLSMTESGSDDLRGERKELLDRIEGQSKSISELTGKDGDPIKFEEVNAAKQSLLRGIIRNPTAERTDREN